MASEFHRVGCHVLDGDACGIVLSSPSLLHPVAPCLGSPVLHARFGRRSDPSLWPDIPIIHRTMYLGGATRMDTAGVMAGVTKLVQRERSLCSRVSSLAFGVGAAGAVKWGTKGVLSRSGSPPGYEEPIAVKFGG